MTKEFSYVVQLIYHMISVANLRKLPKIRCLPTDLHENSATMFLIFWETPALRYANHIALIIVCVISGSWARLASTGISRSTLC